MEVYGDVDLSVFFWLLGGYSHNTDRGLRKSLFDVWETGMLELTALHSLPVYTEECGQRYVPRGT
jgi:hypothetical protein